jgi:hypothetical protein
LCGDLQDLNCFAILVVFHAGLSAPGTGAQMSAGICLMAQERFADLLLALCVVVLFTGWLLQKTIQVRTVKKGKSKTRLGGEQGGVGPYLHPCA